MPAFSTEVAHQLGQDAAKTRLDTFLQKVSEKYPGQIGDMNNSWEGNILKFSFATFGIKISGQMEVFDDKVALNGEIPFSAMMFKGKISNGIKEGLERALTT
ncbi:MAG: polyhydroxyalkanoic acid system family protein [Planctomycetales bacterium]|nr:polyhydroxyalkanoic acid system family protein [Planctomycetales bacterium]